MTTDPGGTEAEPRLRDYVRWHDAYADPSSDLSKRLAEVQSAIEEWLDRCPGSLTVLSSCAGQGHDILGVLDRRAEDRGRVSGTLVELDPTNAAIARERIASLGVDFRVEERDAGISDTYTDCSPADLVLLSGIMGNISAADIRRLVLAAPQLCRPGATVIWTRGAQEPDLGPAIRDWFREAGFEELRVAEHIQGSRMRMGSERYVGDPKPLVRGQHLFTFLR